MAAGGVGVVACITTALNAATRPTGRLQWRPARASAATATAVRAPCQQAQPRPPRRRLLRATRLPFRPPQPRPSPPLRRSRTEQCRWAPSASAHRREAPPRRPVQLVFPTTPHLRCRLEQQRQVVTARTPRLPSASRRHRSSSSSSSRSAAPTVVCHRRRVRGSSRVPHPLCRRRRRFLEGRMHTSSATARRRRQQRRSRLGGWPLLRGRAGPQQVGRLVREWRGGLAALTTASPPTRQQLVSPRHPHRRRLTRHPQAWAPLAACMARRRRPMPAGRAPSRSSSSSSSSSSNSSSAVRAVVGVGWRPLLSTLRPLEPRPRRWQQPQRWSLPQMQRLPPRRRSMPGRLPPAPEEPRLISTLMLRRGRPPLPPRCTTVLPCARRRRSSRRRAHPSPLPQRPRLPRTTPIRLREARRSGRTSPLSHRRAFSRMRRGRTRHLVERRGWRLSTTPPLRR